MEKIKIEILQNLYNKEETFEMYAIKDNNVIKYNDLENNKMEIDILNDIIIRENSDYTYRMDFNNEIITIKVKSLNKEFDKKIKKLLIDKGKHYFNVKYHLIDEGIINEYYVKF